MKKILALFLALVLTVSLAACGTQSSGDDTATGMKTFTVYVVHADGAYKDFTYSSDAEFLGPVLLEEGLIQGNEGPYGMEITQVDGEQAIYATDGAYWAFYIGEDYATTGVDTTPITDGGVYKLVYTFA